MDPEPATVAEPSQTHPLGMVVIKEVETGVMG
jgi:hypothetical protein